MREEIKYFVYVIGLGVSLVTYAHFNFATSSRVQKVEEKIEGLATRQDVKDVKEELTGLRKEIIELYKSGRE